MATTPDYIEFVCGQICGAGDICCRKMFGEYMVYVNDKPVLTVCDNTVFVKIVPELDAVMEGADRGFPYEGAREHYILDIEDTEKARAVIAILERITPPPRRRSVKK